MNPEHVPIIRLELQNMKHSIWHALTQYEVEIDQYIQEALDRVCSHENIREVVMRQTKATLEYELKELIDHFFKYGDGRKALEEMVWKKLSEILSKDNKREA